MAIVILGLTQCPLCDEILAAGQSTVATSHFIQSPEHPLWRFSDAAMHYDCFQAWPMREAFVAEYNDSMGRVVWGNGCRHRMRTDGIVVAERIGRNS